MQQWDEAIYMIGSGSMAEAFIRGMTDRRAVQSDRVFVTNRNHPERLRELQERYGVTPETDVTRVRDCRLVILAAKPGDCAAALAQVQPYLNGRQLIVSLAAGLTIDFLQAACGGQARVVRTMPNIPVAVLAGVTGVSFQTGINQQDRDAVLFLLSQLGEVAEVREDMMDAVTALSGSGPGFVCLLLEAMEAAAVELGFAPDVARRLLLQTVVGTVQTLQQWELTPEEMRKRVTSPNGTTHAGIMQLENGGVRAAIRNALTAAASRSAEMAQTYRLPAAESERPISDTRP